MATVKNVLAHAGKIKEKREGWVNTEDPSKVWMGEAPSSCNICSITIPDHNDELNVFIDGKTKMGPWAFMCEPCHAKLGVGLGTGKGQRYKKT